MRLSIISDLHYPQTITRQTVLSFKAQYSDQFYVSVELDIKQLSPHNTHAFLVNGDFAWNLACLSEPPIIPQNWDIYNSHIYYLMLFRTWLDQEIPLILVQGNHDIWMNTSLKCVHGSVRLNLQDYNTLLRGYFKLSAEQAHNVLLALSKTLVFDLPVSVDGDWGYDIEIPLGDNIYFLQDSGLLLDGVYFYGIGALNPDLSPRSTSFFGHKNIAGILGQIKHDFCQQKGNHKRQGKTGQQMAIPTAICTHIPPADPQQFLHAFQNSHIAVSKIFWGHSHGLSSQRLRRYQQVPGFTSTLPEQNHFKIQSYVL